MTDTDALTAVTHELRRLNRNLELMFGIPEVAPQSALGPLGQEVEDLILELHDVLKGIAVWCATDGSGQTYQLYEVTDELLARLDKFEGCPTLYQRETIALKDGSSAEAYVMPRQRVGRAPHIKIGCWRTWRSRSASQKGSRR